MSKKKVISSILFLALIFSITTVIVFLLNYGKGLVTANKSSINQSQQIDITSQEVIETTTDAGLSIDDVNAYEWFNFVDYENASTLIEEVEAIWGNDTKQLLMELNRCAFRTYNSLHGMVIDDTIRLEQENDCWKINCEVITEETVYLASISLDETNDMESVISSDEDTVTMYNDYLSKAYD